MVDAQLAYAARSAGPRRLLERRPRPPRDPRARLPALLRAGAANLVCVHAEADAWPYAGGEREGDRHGDRLVQWVARRVATGETFEAFADAGRALCPTTPFHLDVDRATLERAAPRGELFDAWSRFVRPSDVVCSWGDYAPRVFEASGGVLPAARVDLRHACRLYVCGRVGTIDACSSRLGVPPSPPLGHGRGGRRLAALSSIAAHLASPLQPSGSSTSASA
jgi:hypothetical protein